MKMGEAIGIINMERTGYMVTFEWKQGRMLTGDHFPDKHGGEPLIATEEEAWVLASKFAAATKGRVVNVYVIGSDFAPVPRYRERMIENRAEPLIKFCPVCRGGYQVGYDHNCPLRRPTERDR